jgi:uncharacterized protein (TIGR03790 family)
MTAFSQSVQAPTGRLRNLVAIFCLLSLTAGPLSAALQETAVEDLKSRLLVVYNKAAPESRELAFSYASARNLTRSQILEISCSTAEEISRAEFESQIRQPIRKHLLEKKWLKTTTATVNLGTSVKKMEVARENQIWAIVLIRGVPLKIRHDELHPVAPDVPDQFRKNEAAVDSELALLPFGEPEVTGFLPNPYYSNSRLRPFSDTLARKMILVTRLDGPTPDDVRRMIRDSVATEQLELTGRALYDARGIKKESSGYMVGDVWLRQSAQFSRDAGLEVDLDDRGPTLAATRPIEDIALYAGWYDGHVSGPFKSAGFRFRPGAVAYHLHSYSASSVRNPGRHWVGPLIARGAAATMGSVYEPYLRMTPDLSIFFKSLLSGQTFAEAAYQSQSVLSWMVTMVGDPLYRPFPRDPLKSAQIAQQANHPDSHWLLLRIARLICAKDIPRQDKIDRVTRMVDALPDAITYEGLGRILSDLKAPEEQIISAFRKAEALAKTDAGVIRNGLAVARIYSGQKDTAKAMAEYERLLAQSPKAAERFGLPDEAISLAARSGWKQLSPRMQTYLAPVEDPASPATGTGKAAPAPPEGPKVRKDLVPKKPVFTPPKPGKSNNKPPQYQNPNIIRHPGS